MSPPTRHQPSSPPTLTPVKAQPESATPGPRRWLGQLGNPRATSNAGRELDRSRADGELVDALALRLRRRELGLDRPLPAFTLADIAHRVATHEPLWRAVVRHDPGERTPVRLIGTDRYEVWVIGWTKGQGVVWHDHGRSAGALLVVEGELAEHTSPGGATQPRRLTRDDLRDLPVGIVHNVRHAGTAPATSIHVYSPPLDTMTHFDEHTLLPTGSEAIALEPAVLPAAVVPVLLHPATVNAATTQPGGDPR